MPEQAASSSSSADPSSGALDSSAGAAGDDGYTKTGVSKAWHQPFPHIVPDFPVRQKLKKETLLPDEQETRGAGVPAHLPCYPPVHTYKRSHGSRKRPAGKEQGPGGVPQRARSTVVKSLGVIEDVADQTERDRSMLA